MVRRVQITVDDDLCKGCGICILHCPAKVLEPDVPTDWGGQKPQLVTNMETKCMLVRGEKGVPCRLCEKRCPDIAIMVEVEDK